MATPLNILIVEDSQDDADLILAELRHNGFAPQWRRVQTEPDFLAELRNLPDIILSDYSMPQFTGLRAAKLLQESGLNIPFILISGTVGEELAVEAMKHGATDYLLKDRIARLGNAVQRALEQKQLREARWQVELALRASEEKFRELAENINEVFWITNPSKHQMLYISPAYERIWGRTCDSLYQSPQSWVEAVHAEDRQRVLAASLTQQGGGKYDETYRIVRPDGALRWIHDRGFPVRNATGDIYRIVGTAEDITERKETEHQLRQSQKMEGIGLLAGGVAHDFNNILLIIQLNLEMVLMIEPNLKSETMAHLVDIGKAADRAAALNRQLLTFSRKEAMQMQLLDLNDLTANFSKMLRRIVGEDIQLRNDFAAPKPFIRADPGMVEQVIMNLAVNARDAMPNGGQLILGTEFVLVEPAHAELNPRRRAGQFVCLSVRDTGVGIPPEILPHIFEPFFTTKGIGNGTGLGLATVFGIAEHHNGWVEVSSEVGAGTSFRVLFPFAAANDDHPQWTVAERVRGGSERILLVEDEKDVRDILVHTLEFYGYTVVDADSGITARRIWEEHGAPIDLLITDMLMPGGLTGLDLVNLLRLQKPTLKVVLMSGYSGELARGDLARAKAVTYFRKPFSPRDLAEAVRKCLDAD